MELVLGAAARLLALEQWRRRPRGDQQAPSPMWTRAMGRFVNPKNLLTVAAAAAIAGTGIDAGQQAISLAVLFVVGALGPGAPVAIYFALGKRSREMLDELKTWMAAHNAAILAVIMLLIGAKLLGDGVGGL